MLPQNPHMKCEGTQSAQNLEFLRIYPLHVAAEPSYEVWGTQSAHILEYPRICLLYVTNFETQAAPALSAPLKRLRTLYFIFRNKVWNTDPSGETDKSLSVWPIYDWNCISKNLLDAAQNGFTPATSPPLECPVSCYHLTTCWDCLRSPGGEGGSRQCFWSVTLQQVQTNNTLLKLYFLLLYNMVEYEWCRLHE